MIPSLDRTKIVSGVSLTPQLRSRILEAGGDLVAEAGPLGELILDRAATECAAWFGPGLTPVTLAECSSLQWLQTTTVGLESVLFPELVSSPVVLTNIPGDVTSTAEHAFAVILAVARGIPPAVDRQDRHEWRVPTPAEVLPLAGSVMVVIGAGRIGSRVARLGQAFGMRMLGITRTAHEVSGFDEVGSMDRLEEFVGRADWVVAVLPATDGTGGLISREIFSAMRASSVFVNVGRGCTVDEVALADVMADRGIRYAALDVFGAEPLAVDSPLWSAANVLITPHSAGVVAGSSSLTTGVDVLCGNLRMFRGGTPLPVVDKHTGY